MTTAPLAPEVIISIHAPAWGATVLADALGMTF